MEKWLEEIHLWGRTCLNCGFFRTQPSLFCRDCEAAVWRESYNPQNLQISSGLRILGAKALFLWEQDRNRALSKLISHLKNGGPQVAYNHYGFLMAEFLKSDRKLDPNTWIIPIPPSKKRGKDHAWRLAEAVSRGTGFPLKPLLKRENTKGLSQKSLTRSARRRVRLVADEKITPSQSVVLIDDILTTGSTAISALQALGNPPQARLLTMAYRTLVAGTDLV